MGTRDRRVPKRFLIAAALLAMTLPPRAVAEEYDPPGRVARLKSLQGRVSFQPAGEPDWVAAVVNRPTTTGDRLWTDPGARAELSIGSATIRLAGTTGFSFLNLDDRTVQIELTQGTLGIRVLRLGRDETFEVDTPNQAFTILRPGQYRIEASEDGYTTFATVRDGEGEATGAGQNYTVRSGESATFTGVDSLQADIGDAGGADEFDNWGRDRDRRVARSRSARYVSRDVVGYEDLDDYGSWRSDPGYGNVWMPTRVARGWVPYRDGHWAWISPWGWTWVDDQPWGYAPFHYGRWVHVRGSWGWVPGPIRVRPVYAPALVAFIGGPGFGVSVSVGGGGYAGNVGWFPLGPREVYVPAYHVSPAYVNRVNVSNTTVSSTTITTVYNTQVTNNYSSTNITYVNRTVPGGVTAVPHGAFTSAQPVARAAVAVNVRQVASAPVGARVAVAPTRESVLGIHASTASNAARPPPAIASRPVVAKVAPPPPPVPFARQQEALAARPGQPLARQEVEKLRPADRAPIPLVKQAPPGKPATPETRRPAGQPPAGRPGQPATAQPSRAQPGAQPQPSAQPAAAGPGQPARPQPSGAPPGKPQETRTDRPPSAQPSRQPQPGAQPGAAGPGQPTRPQPSSAPPGKPQEARPDRPPSAQPGEKPAPATDAPGRPSPQADRPQQPRPQAAPGQNRPQAPAERARKEQENR
jgi:hypothetical protein